MRRVHDTPMPCILQRILLKFRSMLPVPTHIDLGTFAPPTTFREVEVRIDQERPRALVSWPWHLDYAERVAPVLETVRFMGFTQIVETGAIFRDDATWGVIDYEYYLLEAE